MGADRSIYWIRGSRIQELGGKDVIGDVDWAEALFKIQGDGGAGMIASAPLYRWAFWHDELIQNASGATNKSVKNLIRIIEVLEPDYDFIQRSSEEVCGMELVLVGEQKNFVLNREVSKELIALSKEIVVCDVMKYYSPDDKTVKRRPVERSIYELVYGLSDSYYALDRQLVSSVYY
ncbi:hypothetical protein SAMN02745181_0110 [Rubritalea squalenifaciens DSM 18772]|uniref:Uncharacterized protein n=1 Tax=Rubritalea squalenifaciens DSM 18772 TaxID=1123071 RepID=A0A1M6B3M3_9BACT|nr:hypothetical protein [Rubritalea squalenifaciens]SHI43344.1 hypothetical protein SAMN02745181_0110 [Rubritalea squalenifaciens DSM 18772]